MSDSWRQSCANPVFHYADQGKPYPAYPGHAIDSYAQWNQECIQDPLIKENLSQYGNCAFDAYVKVSRDAAGRHSGSPVDPVTGKRKADNTCGGTTGKPFSVPLEESTMRVVGGTPAVCFVNFKDEERDHLCIFKNFSDGNVNVEQMDPARRVKKLSKLIEAAALDLPGGDIAQKRLCFHHGDQASVGWTHMHTFDQALDVKDWPDELADTNAYCVEYRGSAEATAQDMEKKIAARLCKNQPECVAQHLTGDNYCCPANDDANSMLGCCKMSPGFQ